MRTRQLVRRTVWGAALLLALVGGPTGPAGVLHLALDDDPACHLPVAADCEQASLRAATSSPAAAPEHCGTCHGLCSLRYFAPDLAVVGLHQEELGPIGLRPVPMADAESRLELPARAPPARLS
jgi:hypothetical protein